jgi:hypothetical protein
MAGFESVYLGTLATGALGARMNRGDSAADGTQQAQTQAQLSGADYLTQPAIPLYGPPRTDAARPAGEQQRQGAPIYDPDTRVEQDRTDTYKGEGDKAWPLQRRMSEDDGRYGPKWMIDRGASAVASVLAASRDIPELSAKLPVGKDWPTVNSLRSINREEWGAAGRSQLGKTLAASWLGNTAVDQVLFSDKSTSWVTTAVDVIAPFAAKAALGRFGMLYTIAGTIGLHSAEKYFIEEKR